MKTKFTADFETATWLEDETFVWAWAVCEIENEENLTIGNNIDSFMEYCKGQKNSTFYFHNLKFDGEFILYWLLNNGFKHVEKREDIKNNTFTTLISDMGMFYQITVYFEKKNKKTHKVTFIDSLKIIPFSVEQIAKSFNLEISKLKIDYNKPRERNHILTEEERAYVTNDVKIVAQALNVLFEENLTKMTQGSNALNDFKGMLSFSKFGHYFPLLTTKLIKTLDKVTNGGFTYLNPIYKEKEVENITNLDVNSLYPSVMRYCKLPFGEPIFYEGKYKEDNVYDLYIQMITCSFKIKPNHIPTIQIKNSSSFRFNEYLETSATIEDPNNEECLVLTSIDLKLFLDHYDVKNLKYIAGWKFKSIRGIFDEYIDKWVERKNNATLERK